MIYLVYNQQKLWGSDNYKTLSIEDALKEIQSWGVIQFDTETSGRDPHLCTLLCAQFGNDAADKRIVVDCTTVDITLFKELLETKYIIGQNLKFDLQFLYNYGIIPRKVYDTMIVEQLLYLGYPSGQIGYSLKDIAYRYLGVDIDKTVRGEIIWRGLDESVIMYAAGDVTYLEKVADAQYKACVEKQCTIGAKLECDAVPAMAYLEWCGIKLDQEKWQAKMQQDKEALAAATKALDDYAKHHPKLQQWVKIDPQGDLWTGFDLEPKWTVDWQKNEVIKVIQALGFDTAVKDKKTGEDKDSVMEKVLKTQKGIDDTFLKLYFNYQEHYKVCSSFGQGHLDAVNPVTGRIHTVFRQIGTASGRMSCGSDQPNTDLAKAKQLSQNRCKYPK